MAARTPKQLAAAQRRSLKAMRAKLLDMAYRSAEPTRHPVAAPVQPAGPLPDIPPCTGHGKGCTDSEDAPHLHSGRAVPEPTALALVGIGMAALAAHRTNRSPT